MTDSQIVPAPIENLPRVILKPRKALPFFGRHPWVFAGAVGSVEGSPQTGAEVALLSHEREFIARGLFNSQSNIQVRLYSWDGATPVDRDLLSGRLDAALAWRERLHSARGTERSRTAQRLVYSEADGLSGLVVDRYSDWLLVQLTSAALAQRQETLIELLVEKLRPSGIWLRTEKGIGEAEGLEISDGLVSGREPPRPLFIEENGIQFGVDVVQGQKTGFYLDQSDNRLAVARYVRGHRVLDAFCYTGGFSLTAVKLGAAASSVGIDTSETALATARANAELNGIADHALFEKADVYNKLGQLAGTGDRFDTVILDPPKLVRHRAGVKKALRGYYSLNQLAVEVLNPGGMLVTCSCSGHVSRDDFEQMLASVAAGTKRHIQILEARGQAPDHPVSVSCLETSYLKCYICRVV